MDKLETYLNDHLTGSVVAIDLARRRAAAQGEDGFGSYLRHFSEEVERDQQTLRGAMQTLGVSTHITRELLGTAASWLDSIRGTLSLPGAPNILRDIELLIVGVRGKELLWKALERLNVKTDPPMAALRARARDQITSLEELHARAVALELGSIERPPGEA